MRLQKLNIKKTELQARREALIEKEAELHNVEFEIKCIQTEIGNIKNFQVLDRVNTQDHRELIQKSLIILNCPIVTQVPGEVVEVSISETKTVTEEPIIAQNVDVFTSFGNNSHMGHNPSFPRY